MNNTNENIHNRIAKLRKENGFTLQQVADAIGVGNNTISRYETGRREPRLETWQKLADFFGVSVGYLQGIDEAAKIPWDFKAIKEFAKENPDKDKLLAFMQLRELEHIDKLSLGGFGFEKILNSQQINTLLTTVDHAYSSWLAYMNYKKLKDTDKDPDIDSFFNSYEALVSEVGMAASMLYESNDPSEYDITYADLIKLIEPVTEQFKQINARINKRPSFQEHDYSNEDPEHDK